MLTKLTELAKGVLNPAPVDVKCTANALNTAVNRHRLQQAADELHNLLDAVTIPIHK